MNQFLIALLSILAIGPVLADDVQVAVAANFNAPIEEIGKAFNKATGHQLKVSTGSSGKFYAQIKNGAPFQVFLSADEEKPALLEKDGLAVQGSRFTYAIGKLVLWSADPAVVDAKGQILMKNQFNKLAIANPKTAPYGEAAMETLGALKIKSLLEPKLVMGENIGQTYQFVATGNAEIGFVALSQVTRENKITSGSAWVVPEKLYSPIKQDAVLLVNGKDSPAARLLMTFLRSEDTLNVIKSYGYGVK